MHIHMDVHVHVADHVQWNCTERLDHGVFEETREEGLFNRIKTGCFF